MLALALAACGGGGGGGGSSSPPPSGGGTTPTKYTIGGQVSGLTGAGLVLQDNGGDNLAVSANGTFTFATSLSAGSAYAVTVATQPAGQTCSVANGSGTANANVTTVAVTCAAAAPTTVAIGGQVTGLSAGNSVVLQDNGGDNLTVAQNGPFTFATKINVGAAYAVTVATQPSGETCTVTGGSGTAAADVTTVAVACAATGGGPTVTIGGTVTGLQPNTSVILQDNGGDNLQVVQNGPFTFGTPINTGATYAVTVATQPTGPAQLCRVTGGTGTASANVTTVAITCAQVGKFVYVANHSDNTITGYAIDPTTGALTSTGPDVPDGNAPAAVSLAPNGHFAFSASDNGQKINIFSIDPASGALTPAGTFDNSAHFPTGSPFPDIAVDAQSAHLYIASQGDNLVAAYSIDGGTGALTFINTYPAGTGAGGIPAFSPDGKYLYVVNQSTSTTPNPALDNSVSGYAINTDGSLTPLGTWPTGGVNPTWISFRPDGKFAYVSNSNNGSHAAPGTVSVFSVANGVLTLIPTATATVGDGPADLTIDPSGTHLYVPNRNSGDISVFAIDPTAGTLTAVGANGQPAGNGPMLVVLEPTGRFAYVASSFGNDVWSYTIQPDGSLVQLGAATPTGPAPSTGVLAPLFVNIDPSGQFAYVSNSQSGTGSGHGGGIAAFTIDQSTGPTAGTLTPITGSPYRTGLGAFQVSISPEAPGVRD